MKLSEPSRRTLLNRIQFFHVRLDCPLAREGKFLALVVPPEVLIESDDEGIELICTICHHFHQFYITDENEMRVRTY